MLFRSWLSRSYTGVRELELAGGKREKPNQFFVELVGKILMVCLRCASKEELEKEQFDKHPLSLQPWIPSAPLGMAVTESDGSLKENLLKQEDDVRILNFTANNLAMCVDVNLQEDAIKGLTLAKYVLAGLPREV